MEIQLKNYLETLYPNQGDTLFQTVKQLIGPTVKGERRELNHRDALLITYPHQIQDASSGVEPLRLMSKFYNNHLKSCFSGVHFLPFFPYSSDGGFAVIDFEKVDDEFGNWADIQAIEGDLMYDAVFNHTSSKHRWFQGYLEGEKKLRDFYHHFDQLPQPGSVEEKQLRMVVRPRASELLAEFDKDDGDKTWAWATFGPDQLDLNFSNPLVLLELIKVLLFYVEQGATFIRVDAVPFLWKELGTNCMHHPKTHTIVKLLRTVLDLKAPQVCLITESNVPHDENISYLDDGHCEAQLVYNFSLAPLIMHSLEMGTAKHLKAWVDGLKPLPGTTSFFNFTATHDGIGVRPLEGILPDEEIFELVRRMEAKGGFVNFRRIDGEERPYEMNITWSSALKVDDLQLHVRRLLCSYSMSLVFPGVPGVYFHNLFGTENWFEEYNQTLHKRDINRRKFQQQEIDQFLADSDSLEGQTFAGLTEMMRLRQQNEIFHPQAEFIQCEAQDEVWCVERRWQGKTARFYHNLSDTTQTVDGLVLRPYEHIWQLP